MSTRKYYFVIALQRVIDSNQLKYFESILYSEK